MDADRREVEADADRREVDADADRREVDADADRREVDADADRREFDADADRRDVEPAADRAVRKFRGFVAGLDQDEREVIARFIAPGVERAVEANASWGPDAARRWLKGADGQRRDD